MVKDDISKWTDVVKAYAGDSKAFAIKKDGTILTAGNIDADLFKDWTDIKEFYDCDDSSYIGLRNDGSIVALYGEYANLSAEDYDEINTWTDIEKISVASDHVVGLKTDGTVVAVGNNSYGQCDVA